MNTITVCDFLRPYAEKRSKIKNANNGRAYMGAVITNLSYCPLCSWV